jgi:hypothetical protein
MIYRAICYSTHERMRNTPETVVFIQGNSRDGAITQLRRLLAGIWHVPTHTVEFYNMNDEFELFADAFGKPDSGDARFFEIGTQGGLPSYLDDAPLLLLRPEGNKRLFNAWQDVCAIRQSSAASEFAG